MIKTDKRRNRKSGVLPRAEIELMGKIFPQRKFQAEIASLLNSTRYLRKK